MWRGPAWLTIVRDLVCLALGVWGVIHEELSGKPNLEVMILYGVLMVAPSVLASHWLVQSGTDGPSSESPSQPALPSPSSPTLSSSSDASADDGTP